jgi:hypothetical protein
MARRVHLPEVRLGWWLARWRRASDVLSMLEADLSDRRDGVRSHPHSTVLTDGWQPYKGALAGTYDHERYVAPGRLAHELLPGVHRVASLLDR